MPGIPRHMPTSMLTMVPPIFFIDWLNTSRHQKAAGEVVGDASLPTSLGDCQQRGGILTADIVDQTLDTAALGHNRFHTVLHHRLVAEVETAVRKTSTVLVDLGRNCL